MEDPTILFELISGGDIPLVEFDSGPLSLGFQFQKSFGPIYAPPPVMMVIGGGASVTLRIAAGFDTYGIRRAIETGDGAQVLDSLYFKTVDNNGVPIPVVQFTGYLEAGASVSIGILEVGVVGGIKLTVGFYWNDPNGDGKFRLFEFGAAVANNPICLFNVGGELSLYIKVFVVIGFSPFSVSFDFTLVNIKLLDFSFKPNCTPPPPRLGGTHDGVLYVFAGKFGGAGPRGNAAWDAKDKAETWAIRQVPEFTDEQGEKHEAAVEVRGIGLTESFSDKDDAIKTVVLDGRNYPGNLTVSFTGGSGTKADAKPGAFTKTAVVFTGGGDDVIRTGEGDAWVDSGAGADNITTLDRADLDLALSAATARVAGGPGPDVITVGNGNDTVTGDGSITVTEATRTVELAPDNASDPHHTSLVGALDVASLKDSALTNLDTANDRRHRRQRPDRGGARCGAPVRQRWRRHHRHRQRQPPRRLRGHQGRDDGRLRREGGALPRRRTRSSSAAPAATSSRAGRPRTPSTRAATPRSARATRAPGTPRPTPTRSTPAPVPTPSTAPTASTSSRRGPPRRRRRRSSAAPRPTSSPAAWARTRSTAARTTTTSWRLRRRSAAPTPSPTPSARPATSACCPARAAAPSCSSAAPAATASTAPTVRR